MRRTIPTYSTKQKYPLINHYINNLAKSGTNSAVINCHIDLLNECSQYNNPRSVNYKLAISVLVSFPFTPIGGIIAYIVLSDPCPLICRRVEKEYINFSLGLKE